MTRGEEDTAAAPPPPAPTAAWTEHGMTAALDAWERLKPRVERMEGAARAAAVLDIDDTVLACKGGACVPNPLGLRVVRELAARGIPYHYVTARRQSDTGEMWTRLQLRMLGLDAGCAGITFMPAGTRCVRSYKAAARRAVEARGWRVQLNMGDQWTDFDPHPVQEHSVPSSYYGWTDEHDVMCIKLPHRLL